MIREIFNFTHLICIKDKTEIARDTAKYNVPVNETWSCYKGLDTHCGRCGTCVERREAFHLAGFKRSDRVC